MTRALSPPRRQSTDASTATAATTATPTTTVTGTHHVRRWRSVHYNSISAEMLATYMEGHDVFVFTACGNFSNSSVFQVNFHYWGCFCSALLFSLFDNGLSQSTTLRPVPCYCSWSHHYHYLAIFRAVSSIFSFHCHCPKLIVFLPSNVHTFSV